MGLVKRQILIFLVIVFFIGTLHAKYTSQPTTEPPTQDNCPGIRLPDAGNGTCVLSDHCNKVTCTAPPDSGPFGKITVQVNGCRLPLKVTVDIEPSEGSMKWSQTYDDGEEYPLSMPGIPDSMRVFMKVVIELKKNGNSLVHFKILQLFKSDFANSITTFLEGDLRAPKCAINECTKQGIWCSAGTTCATEKGTNTSKCQAINECTKQGFWCSAGTTCATEKGTNTSKCQDVDECSNAEICPEKNTVCKNSEGSYDCECNAGYRKNCQNGICEDVDECSDIVDICRAGETCVNEPGRFSCECQSGYVKKDGACVKKDECNCKKHEVCSKGKCKCKKGYKKDKQGHCYHVQISDGYLAGSGDSIHVSSYLSALILGMLGRLAFTA
ncbi:uncharacterized protein LOC144657747 [Oculina patagonica]